MIFKISLTADEYGRMIKSEGRTFDEALFLYEWLQECQDDISTEKDGALPLWALNKHDVMDGLALIPRNDADQLSQVSSFRKVEGGDNASAITLFIKNDREEIRYHNDKYILVNIDL